MRKVKSMLVVTILLMVFVFGNQVLAGQVITVDDDGPADYSTIQDAIDAAVDGDTVVVADGVYTGQGNKNIDFCGRAITVKSEYGPDNCIIDCENSGRGFYFHDGEEANSILDGLIVINSYSTGGGAITCRKSSPTIINCTISNNSAHGSYSGAITCLEVSNPMIVNCIISGNEGGGLDVYSNSNPTIHNCVIRENSAGSGGGLAIKNNSSAIITECDFIENKGVYGGGIFCNNSDIIVSNCFFVGNSALNNGVVPGIGGGIELGYGSSTIKNCVFIDNYADDKGGDIANARGLTTITNCLFTGNECKVYGGGIYNRDNSPSIMNCILWDNYSPNGQEVYNYDNSHPTFSFCDIQGGLTSPTVVNEDNSSVIDGGGNINADPLFVSGPLGDYYLSQTTAGQGSDSPCVDAGSDQASVLGMSIHTTRTDEVFDSGIVDMGYHYPAWLPVEIEIVPDTLNLSSNGKWISCCIWLPEEYDVAEVNTNSILLEGQIAAAQVWVNEEQQVVMTKFSRAEVQDILEAGEVELIISGELVDGARFEGTDTIRVIDKGSRGK
ncbi:MAG: right-handed parallel beta-helix repeat-containing protein [Planctomycetota bacterium]